jgi:nitrous oxidase accessory protein
MRCAQTLTPVICSFLLSGWVNHSAAAVLNVSIALGKNTIGEAIARASDGDVLLLQAGVYTETVIVDKTLTLKGVEGTIVDGGGRGNVLTIDAPGVVVEGLTIRHSGDQLSTEDSGIFVTPEGDGALINNNYLQDNLIGIYLKGPDNAVVEYNIIDGLQVMRVNERGNGVQLWNTPGSIVKANQIRFGRDGIFVTTSHDNQFLNNTFSDLRFAVHYMYTNHSSVIGNISTGNTVGFALMYSRNLIVSDNQSLGDSERGIFFNFTNDSTISGNTVGPGKAATGPEKCVFVYNANFNKLSGNRFEGCDIGIHFTAGSEQNEIWGNNFIANRDQVKYVGSRDLEWSYQQLGNYWSDNLSFDLDGDGIANQPYQPNSIADQIIWRYPLARLLMSSPVLQILQWAQSQFPSLHPGGVVDSYPVLHPLPVSSSNE